MKRSCLSALSGKTPNKVAVFHMHVMPNWDIHLLNMTLNRVSLSKCWWTVHFVWNHFCHKCTSVKSSKRLRSYHILSQFSLNLEDVKIYLKILVKTGRGGEKECQESNVCRDCCLLSSGLKISDTDGFETKVLCSVCVCGMLMYVFSCFSFLLPLHLLFTAFGEWGIGFLAEPGAQLG